VSAIDDFLKRVEPERRRELERLRTLAKEIVPDAQETISYGMPTLKYAGKPFLGFNARKHHVGIYPFSGHVIETLKNELKAYSCSKGAIQVPFDKPIPKTTLKKLINRRIKDIRAAALP
jgi:uncharacterized protein YdhG (YjbR/CyaY superfamily)